MDYYFKHSHFGWSVKDSNSRYIYANEMACTYLNVSPSDIVGCTDVDLTPDMSSCYDRILSDDRKILNTGDMSLVIKTFDFGRRNRLRSFLVEKRRWQINKPDDGIICTWIEITNVYFSTFLRQQTRKPFVFTPPASIFTDKEWEVILLLQCGVKQSAMPDILSISASALRNRLVRCYDKAYVTNTTALLRHCSQKGWDNYIPPFFLKKGYVSLCTSADRGAYHWDCEKSAGSAHDSPGSRLEVTCNKDRGI